MARIASFHLVRESRSKIPFVLARLGLDRARLDRVDGLAFWRLLGTGRGNDTGPGADLSRSAVFAVWNEESDLDDFLGTHPIARRWDHAAESWHVRLRSLGGHGRWRGVDPLDGIEKGERGGPVAIITRADVRRSAGRAFGHAAREVDAELHTAAGLIDVVGIGEAPIGRLATFSLWESMDAAKAFAYAMPRHQQVIDQTRAGSWYSEEMFARFEPYGSIGRWDGRDPLARR
ncbi:MAG: spheroidene monooxygenase [Ilumatobacter sp.]|uniref:spheroidene monooxygenase n=1 Tax=Ilumatobacter sp. TaxID=1967498 RepID=UPI0032994485